MKRMITAVIAAATLLSATAAYAGEPDDAARMAELERYIARAMAAPELKAVGLGVAVVKDGKVLMAKGFGRRRASTGAPYTGDTVQNIGSTSKAFISTALAALVSDGKLAWDDPVVKHLPKFRVKDPWISQAITVRDLMASRVPVQDLPLLPSPLYTSFLYPTDYPEELLERLAHAVVDPRGFRSEYCYDCGLMPVAALVVQAASGMSYPDYVRTRLLEPLGMTSTSTNCAAFDRTTNQAYPHQLSDAERGSAVELAPTFMCLAPGGTPSGGVHTTPADYAKWMLFHLSRTGAPLNGKQVVKRDALDELYRPHVDMQRPLDMSKNCISGPDGVKTGPLARRHRADRCVALAAYGLGWDVTTMRSYLTITHDGSNPGIITIARLFPQKGIGIWVAVNSRGSEDVAYSVAAEAYEIMLDVPKERRIDQLARGVEDTKSDMAELAGAIEPYKVHARPSLSLDRYAGSYSADGMHAGKVDVTVARSGLRAKIGIYTVELLPFRGETFFVRYIDEFRGKRYDEGGEFRYETTTATFEITRDGRVTGFKFADRHEALTYARLDGANPPAVRPTLR